MSFHLSASSQTKLYNVHEDLKRVVEKAIKITDVDFGVLEGIRSIERQEALVASGASKTMNSRHITGHAVDLGAWVDGHYSWDWSLYYKIASAMKKSAQIEGVVLTWGGVWDMTLNDLSDDLHGEVMSYVERRRAQGKHAFIDGPHFELCRVYYPTERKKL